jgi:hypothetical protein
VEKLAVNLCNKLAVFAEGAKNANDKDIAALFKVSICYAQMDTPS